MTAEAAEQVRAAIAGYVDPYVGADLLSAGLVKQVEVAGARARVVVSLGFPAEGYLEELGAELGRRVLAVPGIADADIRVEWQVASHAVQKNLTPLAGVRNVIAVASGKGGVGKSTTAVNLALALKLEGAAVGVLDADVYGPSLPRMMGLTGERPVSKDGKAMEPLVAHGLQCMSIGFLVREEEPTVWRGPMASQALRQLSGSTHWQDLDYLVVDMPPGTGDIQLTLAQQVPVSGAIIVTTPQDIALLDARKGLEMFRKVGVAILGIVENMASHVCSRCGHVEPIFGEGGGARIAAETGVPLLGSLPLDMRIREQADGGRPTVVADPDGPISLAYRAVARRAAAALAASARDYSRLFPKITIEKD